MKLLLLVALSRFFVTGIALVGLPFIPASNEPSAVLGLCLDWTQNTTAEQMAYGFLFDGFHEAVYLVLIPAGIIVCAIGLFSAGFFRRMEEKRGGTMEPCRRPGSGSDND